MKNVQVTYFKVSGKYYTDEIIQISNELNSYTALEKLNELHRIKDMFMMVSDLDDNIEPYIVPHLFSPKERN